MTPSRRTFLLGTAAAAIAPVLPAIAEQAAPFNLTATQVAERIATVHMERTYIAEGAVYGRSPAMVALPSLRELEHLLNTHAPINLPASSLVYIDSD